MDYLDLTPKQVLNLARYPHTLPLAKQKDICAYNINSNVLDPTICVVWVAYQNDMNVTMYFSKKDFDDVADNGFSQNEIVKRKFKNCAIEN